MKKSSYLLRSTFKSLADNRLMNLVSIGSISLALMVMGAVLLIQQNVASLVEHVQTESSVVVYLEDGMSENRRQAIQSKLISHDVVADVQYESKQEALETFRQRLGEQAEILKGLTGNPLPASFDVDIESGATNELEELAGTIGQWEGVESVDYGGQVVERIQQMGGVVQLLLTVIGALIGMVAVFIIFNTIQLSVISREDEIDILKLVGATRQFIGFPFLLSGIIQGLLGSLFGLSLLWFIQWIVELRMSALPFVTAHIDFLTYIRLLIIIILGVLLGVIGSVTAVYRSVRRM